jgi:hypothetical protein
LSRGCRSNAREARERESGLFHLRLDGGKHSSSGFTQGSDSSENVVGDDVGRFSGLFHCPNIGAVNIPVVAVGLDLGMR